MHDANTTSVGGSVIKAVFMCSAVIVISAACWPQHGSGEISFNNRVQMLQSGGVAVTTVR